MAVKIVFKGAPKQESLLAYPKVYALAQAARKEYQSDPTAFRRYIDKVAEVEERLMRRPRVAKLLREYAQGSAA